MKRLALAIVTVVCALMFACGGGSLSVSVSPTTATVPPGQTQQFTATVNNSSNPNVTWQVNSIPGGNTTYGTISTAGVYTAPTTIPGSGTVTITAVPDANTTVTANATVTIADAIAITPSNADVAVQATQQFTAKVTFSTNTNVTWQVNGVAGGNSTYGTISTGGLYTAPNSVPSNALVTITAISAADNTKTATATVQVTPPKIVISPSAPTLAAGSQQGFAATVLEQPVTPTWSVQCPSTVTNGCGTITSGGIYTAPLSPPPGGTVVITATMADGSAQPANTTATIQISNATVAGTYVFGFASSAVSGFGAEAGVISLDGIGNITGGSFDQSGTVAGPVAITGGTYTMSSDGRGTAVVQTSQGPIAWQFAAATNQKIYVARLTASGITETGTLDRQNSATAAMNGGYSLRLAGASTGSTASAFAMVGSLATDGTSTVTSSLADAVVGGTVTSKFTGTGSYTPPAATGRGTLTLASSFGNQTFVYYTVDSTHLKIVETDGVQLAGGDLYRQAAGPFSASSFNERVAFTVSGFKGTVFNAVGGLFTMNGTSGITNRQLDGVTQTVFDTQGSYLVTDPGTGRTTVSWTVNNGVTATYVMYPIAGGGFVVLEADGAAVEQGLALQQTISAPSVFSLAGDLTMGLSGYEANATTPEAVNGSLVVNTQGALSGTLDTASSSGVSVNAELQIGSFTVALSNGRGIATILATSPTLPNATLIFYIVDTNNALVLESDSNRVLAGSFARQF